MNSRARLANPTSSASSNASPHKPAPSGVRISHERPNSLYPSTHNTRVICHGDLHPFNLLVDGDDWTLIDWSTAVVADPHYDLAFTTLMLANPPLGGPAPVRATTRMIGTRIANRFLRSYEQRTGRSVDANRLNWGRRRTRCAPSSRSPPGKPTTRSTTIEDIPGWTMRPLLEAQLGTATPE